MREPEPNNYDELKKVHEEILEQARHNVTREQETKLEAETSTHDVAAHMAAFERELDVREELGQLTPREKIYLLRQEDNRVSMLVKDPSATPEFSKPKIDAERLLVDKEYRQEVERKEREARQCERNGARTHQSDSGGRGR